MLGLPPLEDQRVARLGSSDAGSGINGADAELHGLFIDVRPGSHVLDSAIITMPAYFNHNQIEATRQAGELAAFEVVELLHEPTAAAIYYSWLEGHGDATYLVYDLGGGTFDVSVIRRRFNDY